MSTTKLPSNEHDDLDEAEIFCTICFHSLNHQLYDIKAIPTLSVASCILCFDKLRRRKAIQRRYLESSGNEETFVLELANPSDEDMCSWCRRDDQGTLFLCSKEDQCKHQFCESCVFNNLGSEVVDKIKADDNWQCFVCDPIQLSELQDQCAKAQDDSCYSALGCVDEEDDEMKAKVLFYILEQIVRELNDKSLECDKYIETCEFEIGPELKFLEKKEEMERLKELWKYHFLVLETQDSLLSDTLNELGYGGEVSALHKEIVLAQHKSFSSGEKFQRLSALDSLNSIPLHEDVRSIRKPSEENDIGFDEESDESDQESPNTKAKAVEVLALKAEEDPTVIKYATDDDIDLSDYPKEFSRRVPAIVLKALYNTSSDQEREYFISAYNIPRHIVIVMRYADSEFPKSTNEWSIRKRLHPKVLQALYYAQTPPEIAILGNRYNLSSDLTDVTDFGADNESLVSESDDEDRIKKTPEKRRKTKVSKKLERIALDEEARQDQAYIKRVRKSTLSSMKTAENVRSKDLLSRMQKLSRLNRPPIDHVDMKSSYGVTSTVNGPKSDDEDEDILSPMEKAGDGDDDGYGSEDYSRTTSRRKSLHQQNGKYGEDDNSLSSSTYDHLDDDDEGVLSATFPSIANRFSRSRRKSKNNQNQQAIKTEQISSTVAKQSHESAKTNSGQLEVTTENNPVRKSHSNDHMDDDSVYFMDCTSNDENGPVVESSTGQTAGGKTKVSNPTAISPNDKASEEDCIDLTLDDDEDDIDIDDSQDEDFELKEKTATKEKPSFSWFDKTTKNRASSGKDSNKKQYHKSYSLHLSEETLNAREVEKKRQQEVLAFKYFPSSGGMVINEKRPEGDEAITMVDHFVSLLQPHQVEGVRFLWENTMKSIKDAKQGNSKETYGCILAHCMGLGKTFTVISFLVTLMANPTIRGILDPDTSLHTLDAGFSPERPKPLLYRILVITPKNVLHNWAKEVHKWTPSELIPLLNITTVDVTSNSSKTNQFNQRMQKLHNWYVKGGILVISYDMFRNLVSEDTKENNKLSVKDQQLRLEKAQKYLLNPGPDLVVADEAHIIKNDKSKINEAVSAIRTKRRIALTGTPLQNHLEEYWCMVEWVKKRFLYSRKEFQKLFIRPINQGEAREAAQHHIQQMKKRSHALHHKLEPIVHRKDQGELAKLINKREFILTTRVTDFQRFLYKLYLSKLQASAAVRLFRCFQTLMRISNHPINIVMHSETWKHKNQDKNEARTSLASSRISLKEMARQLKPVHDHFKNQGRDAMERLERAADYNEQNLLKDPKEKSSKTNTPMRVKKNHKKNRKSGNKRKRSAVDNDDKSFNTVSDLDGILADTEDEGEEEEEEDGSDGAYGEDVSDDGYGDEHDEEDDDDDDLSDFVVDDDVVEYEDEDRSFDNDDPVFKKRKSTNQSSSGKKAKRIRLSDSSSSLIEDDKNNLESTIDHSMSKQDMNDIVPDIAAKDDSAKGAAKSSEVFSQATAVNLTQNATSATTPAGETSQGRSSTPNINVIDDVEDVDLNEDEIPDELGQNWWKIALPSEESSLQSLSAKDLLGLSNKMVTVLSLLALTVQENEKMIIFTQSLYTLDAIEKFLMLPKWGEMVGVDDPSRLTNWSRGIEYLRIDGSVSNRQPLIDKFNDPRAGKNCNLMLISTKAGNMGINLQAANRLVLFDCSWNPMHDLQAIFRAYRVGQTRDVFIYRLVSAGTMEEKIYKKQVAKMARANRVLDKQMPNNAFTDKEKSELLRFDDDADKDVIDDQQTGDDVNGSPKKSRAQMRLKQVLQGGTQDKVLTKFLEDFGTSFFSSIENHDSFLEDDSAAHLNEAEKEIAEIELQRELNLLRGSGTTVGSSAVPSAITAAAYEQLIAPAAAVAAIAPTMNEVAAVLAARSAATATTRTPVVTLPPTKKPTFGEQEDQIMIAARSIFINDSHFIRITPAMNIVFNRANTASARTPAEYMSRYEELYRNGRADAYARNSHFLGFKEEVRRVFEKRGIPI